MNNIAIDKDDTLNWLTYSILESMGKKNIDKSEVPTFDEIKRASVFAKNKLNDGDILSEDDFDDFENVTLDFLAAREKCFNDPNFFASKPYGLAREMVDMIKNSSFNPVICTKTLSNHEKHAEVTAAKMKFWKEYFSDIDMMIATGVKHVDAIGLIDDLLKNGLVFNSKNYRPFLVWNHKTANKHVIQIFIDYCEFYEKNINAFDVKDIKEKDIFIVVESNNIYIENKINDKEEFKSLGSFVHSDKHGIAVGNYYIKDCKNSDSNLNYNVFCPLEPVLELVLYNSGFFS